jgi:hypothetical protein
MGFWKAEESLCADYGAETDRTVYIVKYCLLFNTVVDSKSQNYAIACN